MSTLRYTAGLHGTLLDEPASSRGHDDADRAIELALRDRASGKYRGADIVILVDWEDGGARYRIDVVDGAIGRTRL